jgi:fatty-acyl-CoA synthase
LITNLKETRPQCNSLAPRDDKSYVIGEIEPPLTNTTISKLLRNTAKKYGDRDALIFSNRRLTYLDFDREVDKQAKGLLALGLEKGDRAWYLVT